MSQYLALLLGETPDAPVSWLQIEADGALSAHGRADGYQAFVDTLADEAIVSDTTIVALRPGELTALRLLETPPRAQAQFLAAAGFLLEDSLAEAVDDLHIAVARRDGVGLSGADE